MKKYLLLISIGLLVSFISYGKIIAGNPNGKITLVEFYDYQCPHCKNMAPIIEQLINNNNNLRVVYRPIAALNQLSLAEAELALAAQKAGKFTKVHQLLMAHDFTEMQQIHVFKNREELNNLNRNDIAELQANLQLFYSLQASHIPLIVIGTKDKVLWSHEGETSYEVLQHEID